MKSYDIGIIMTCYNRKKLTLRCIEQLKRNNSLYSTTIYVCDDASTDGTFQEIKKRFPEVVLIEGSGNLFWCRGMYQAMKKAAYNKHDLYLMVNDDVDFFEYSIEEMIDIYSMMTTSCGVVGYTVSRHDNRITYGGRCAVFKTFLGRKIGINRNYIVHSTKDKLVNCLLTNWNCFLIDNEIIERIGLIDCVYEHGIGDYDYSLMMNKAGIPVYVTRRPVGYCERNSRNNTFQDNKLKRNKRIKKLFSPKEYPIRSILHYHYKHWGIGGIMYAALIYINFIIKIVLGKEIK